MAIFRRANAVEMTAAVTNVKDVCGSCNDKNGSWQAARKHSRSISDSFGSFGSESESDVLSEGSSGKSSFEYSPRTPALVESPTIDQFHFGMDYEVPTFPTDDTATLMAGKWPSRKAPEFSFTEDVIASITSFLNLEQSRNALNDQEEIVERIGDENMDNLDQIEDIDWDISDDEYASISVEMASTVTLFKPIARPALVSIAAPPLCEKPTAVDTVSMTRQSSRSSTLCSQYSWAGRSSSDASDVIGSTNGDIFYETSQWSSAERLRYKQHRSEVCVHSSEQPQQVVEKHQTVEHANPSAVATNPPPRHQNRKCEQTLPNDQPPPLNNHQEVQSLLPRKFRLARKSSTNLHLRATFAGDGSQSWNAGGNLRAGTKAIFPPAGLPVVVVPTRSSSKGPLRDSGKISKPSSPPSRRLRRKSAKYTIFPQLIH